MPATISAFAPALASISWRMAATMRSSNPSMSKAYVSYPPISGTIGCDRVDAPDGAAPPI